MVETSAVVIVDPTPSFFYDSSHVTLNFAYALVELSDGSLVSCSRDNSAKQWMRRPSTHNQEGKKEKGTLELIGKFIGHTEGVRCVVRLRNDSILTGSRDGTVKEWNTSSCQCINTIEIGSAVFCAIKARNESCVLFGLDNGRILTWNISSQSFVSSFKPHSDTVYCVVELEDGSFVSGSGDTTIKRWEKNGTVLQVLSGHNDWVRKMIQLNSHVLVSASDDMTLKMWQISTAECLRTLTLHSSYIYGLINLSDKQHKFASGSMDNTLRVWDDKGDCIQVIKTKYAIEAMTRLGDGSICTVSRNRLEIRRL